MTKKTKISLLSALLFCFMVIPGLVFAANTPLDHLKVAADNSSFAKVDDNSVSNVVGVMVAAFLSVLGIIFMITLSYAGIIWTSAGGNEEKVGKAKKVLKNSIIGILITVSAYAIYGIMSRFLIGDVSKKSLDEANKATQRMDAEMADPNNW